MRAYRTPKGWFVMRLHYEADETLTQNRLEELRSRQPTEAHWRKEMEIDPHALLGARVYPEFQEKLHVLPDPLVRFADPAQKIPRRGSLFMALDPHPRTPHAALWVLIDHWSDWYVYRDFWPSIVYGETRNVTDEDQENMYTVREYADTFARLEGNKIEWHAAETDHEYGVYRKLQAGEQITERYMDQAGKGFFGRGETTSHWKSYSDLGISCMEPYKIHRAGEDAIRELLRPRRHSVLGEWPRLHIAESCRELIMELKKHRYRRQRRTNDEKELHQDGIESRCHLLDCLRYLATADIGYVKRTESQIHTGELHA